MNRYAQLTKRQQEEFNTLPLGFAFSNAQFTEMMTEWGLDPKDDLDKIVRIPGGGFIQKKDVDLLRETSCRHKKELEDAIAADETGEGFIYEMFYYELANHEYGYTGELDETLETLGYTYEEVMADKRLKRGLKKAMAKF